MRLKDKFEGALVLHVLELVYLLESCLELIPHYLLHLVQVQ